MITDPSNPSSLSKIPKETQFLRYEMIWTQKKKNDRFLSLHPKDPSFKFLLFFLLLEQVTCKMSGPSHRFGGPSWQPPWPGSPRCQWRFIISSDVFRATPQRAPCLLSTHTLHAASPTEGHKKQKTIMLNVF